jgi:hypothetical protein
MVLVGVALFLALFLTLFALVAAAAEVADGAFFLALFDFVEVGAVNVVNLLATRRAKHIVFDVVIAVVGACELCVEVPGVCHDHTSPVMPHAMQPFPLHQEQMDEQ